MENEINSKAINPLKLESMDGCKFRDVIREAFNVTHEIGEDNSPKSAIDQTELASQLLKKVV